MSLIRFRRSLNLAIVLMLLAALVTPSVLPTSHAQADAQFFSQTGKTITGRFLEYWKSHGGIEQQGYPISDIISEKSDTDGKIYTVQYFERAVFEAHPENVTPNDVLLSLLGSFLYKQKYPSGASGQVPNTTEGSQAFPQTGKRTGGVFLDYWQKHGGLAQQGLPLSDEFIETSSLDGKQYKVQYFERAVFEYHPENTGTSYEVLLSQLGTFRWQAKQTALTPTTIPVTPLPPTAGPATATPLPPGVLDCSGIPASSQGVVATPGCGPYGTEFHFAAPGFTPGEDIQVSVLRPNGIKGTPFHDTADASGNSTQAIVTTLSPVPGVWQITFAGVDSGKTATGFFKVTGPDVSGCTDGPPPLSRDASVSPACGIRGYTTFQYAATGFKPGELVGIYFTLPNRNVFDARFQEPANQDGYVIGVHYQFYDVATNVPGVWAATFEGVESHIKRIAYFKLYKP